MLRGLGSLENLESHRRLRHFLAILGSLAVQEGRGFLPVIPVVLVCRCLLHYFPAIPESHESPERLVCLRPGSPASPVTLGCPGCHVVPGTLASLGIPGILVSLEFLGILEYRHQRFPGHPGIPGSLEAPVRPDCLESLASLQRLGVLGSLEFLEFLGILRALEVLGDPENLGRLECRRQRFLGLPGSPVDPVSLASLGSLADLDFLAVLAIPVDLSNLDNLASPENLVLPECHRPKFLASLGALGVPGIPEFLECPEFLAFHQFQSSQQFLASLGILESRRHHYRFPASLESLESLLR